MVGFALSAAFVMAGCEGAKTDATATSEFEPKITAQDEAHFTTEGKQTTTIETPWGPREIYSPAQDKKIIAILRNTNIDFQNNPFAQRSYLKRAYYEQVEELGEIGCSVSVNSFCEACVYKPVTTKNPDNFSKPKIKTRAICHKLDYGSDRIIPYKHEIFGHVNVCKSDGNKIIDMSSVDISKYQLTATDLAEYLFQVQCEKWKIK